MSTASVPPIASKPSKLKGLHKVYVTEDWEKWFAWYPVEVNGRKVWLRNVYRRCCYTQIFGETFNEFYEYGNILDVLKS